MRKKAYYFLKFILCIFLFSISENGFAQSGRGAASCPDFSAISPKKNKYILKTVKVLKNKVFNKEAVIKITPYSNFGVSTSSVTTETSASNTAVTTTSTDSSGWETADFNKAVTGFFVDYEVAFKKKSSVQISIGYENAQYASSYRELQPTTDNTGIGMVMEAGMVSNKFLFAAAYRYYFLYSLRRLYVSSFIKIKTGNTTYKDLIKSEDFNDFDFNEKSFTGGFGLLAGYQVFLRKKIAFDFFIGPEYRYNSVYGRTFLYENVNQETFDKNRNIDKLNNIYDKQGIGVRWGISIGYKFGKKK